MKQSFTIDESSDVIVELFTQDSEEQVMARIGNGISDIEHNDQQDGYFVTVPLEYHVTGTRYTYSGDRIDPPEDTVDFDDYDTTEHQIAHTIGRAYPNWDIIEGGLDESDFMKCVPN